MRDPLASNTDPTDEELEELFRAAFAPEKLGLQKLRAEHLQRIRKAVNDALLADKRMRQEQDRADVAAGRKTQEDMFFIPDDVFRNLKIEFKD